jgi:hypothetical protein
MNLINSIRFLAEFAFIFGGGMFAVWLVHQLRKFW